MKLGIISDTHGFFHPELATIFSGVDDIIHAGDIGTMAVVEQLRQIAPVIAVRGNIDGEEFFDYPKIERRVLEGIRVCVIHNAGDIIHPIYDLRTRILSEPTDLLISGHYHGYWCTQIEMAYGNVLWLSPGAAGNSGHHQERTALILSVAPECDRTGDLRKDCRLEKVHLGNREFL